MGALDGVCMDNGGAEEADRKEEHMGEGHRCLQCYKEEFLKASWQQNAIWFGPVRRTLTW